MARLVSYKTKDENRYSTFGNDASCNSHENLTDTNRFKLIPKKKIQSPKSKIKTIKMTATAKRTTAPTISASATRNDLILKSTGNSVRNHVTNVNINKRRINNSSSSSNAHYSGSRSALCPKLCCRQRKAYLNLGKCGWYLCCWGCCNLCKCTGYGCNNDNDDDDDDDIDAKFEQYKCEMRLKGNVAAATAAAATGTHNGDGTKFNNISMHIQFIISASRAMCGRQYSHNWEW